MTPHSSVRTCRFVRSVRQYAPAVKRAQPLLLLLPQTDSLLPQRSNMIEILCLRKLQIPLCTSNRYAGL
eukprot:UN27736